MNDLLRMVVVVGVVVVVVVVVVKRLVGYYLSFYLKESI
jgi:hypothetical protein